MHRTLLILILLLAQVSHAQTSSDEIQVFLKSCGYGILGGAVVGTVSLVLEDKPSEHYNNISRGASLGLYAGIAYGIHAINQQQIETNQKNKDESRFVILPRFYQAKVEGIDTYTNLIEF